MIRPGRGFLPLIAGLNVRTGRANRIDAVFLPLIAGLNLTLANPAVYPYEAFYRS